MNAKKARDLTEIVLGAIDDQKHVDAIKKDLDYLIEVNANSGSWECNFPLSRYIINENIINMIRDHYVLMGFKIFNAVRKAKLALYIKPLSPLKCTTRVPISTCCAPKSFNSLATISSKPKKVLAVIL